MEGITAWVDVFPWGMPPKMHGLGIEAEGRDINFNRPSGITKLRHDTGLIGPIYSLHHFKNVRPYAKYLMGIGSIDFPATVGPPTYTHDTFLVLAPGGRSVTSGSGNTSGHAVITSTNSGTTPLVPTI